MTEGDNRPKNIEPKLTFTERTLKRGCVTVMSVATIGLIQEFSNILTEFATRGQAGVSVESVHRAMIFAFITATQFSAIKRLE